jgi:hypothetical protein
MADEVQNAAVNSGAAAAGSAPDAAQGNAANTPAGENTGANANQGENRIPQSRFNEVIEQRNREREMREQYEKRIRDLEQNQPNPAVKSVEDQEVDRLVSRLNLSKEAAREIVQSSANVAKAQRQVVDQRLQQYELNGWREQLTRQYPDYQATEAKMAEVWNTLEPHERQLALSSRRGLEMLYSYAKGQGLGQVINQAREQAANEVYDNKLVKQAVSSVPGASAKATAPLNAASIAAMSIEEYKRRLPEINEALTKGLI